MNTPLVNETIPRFAIALCLLLLAAGSGWAQTPAESNWNVAENGVTTLELRRQNADIKVRIQTIEVAFDQSSSPTGRLLSKTCIAGQHKCSFVDAFEIFLGESAVEVPDRSFRDLTNVRSGRITVRGSRYAIEIRGGDGADGYVARFRFNKHRVYERTVASSLDGSSVLERTRYYLQRARFDR